MPSNHLILCPQSFPASGSFPMSQLFTWGGQSFGASASASVLPMNTQDRSPLGWTGWNFLQSKGLLRVFSNTTVQKHQFFGAQLSSPSNSHVNTSAGKNWWASCSYRKFPQGGSTSSCPTLVPPATRALGKVGFLGCELEWNVLEQTPKGLCLTASSPSIFTHPPAWCPPGAPLPLEVPRRQHSQEGGFSWGPQCHIPWVLGEFILALEARGSGHHRWGALGILVPARENQSTSLSGVSMKHTLPGCLRPTAVQPWDASLLGASVRIPGTG